MADTEPISESASPAPDASTAPEAAPIVSTPTAEQQIAQLKDLLLRKAAEFENYKKRVEQESSAIVRMANEGLILALLPIVDDLERSLKAAKDPKDPQALVRGVDLIFQKFGKVLESQGVSAFETAGKPFDVHFHDALMQMPTAAVPPSTVLEEVEKGYTMHGKVIRHAKVVVAAPPADTPSTDASA